MNIGRRTGWMAGAGLAAFALIGLWLQNARPRIARTDAPPTSDVSDLVASARLRSPADTAPQQAEPDDDSASADTRVPDISPPLDDPTQAAEPGSPVPGKPDPSSPVQIAVRGESADHAALLGHFANTSIPLRQRTEDIRLLAQARNETSKQALMALGDARLYLNRKAVEALGAYRDAEVQRYLTLKLHDADSLVVCAAIRALARSTGAGAVRDLADVIRRNRRRDDGHDEMVREAAVETLGQIGSSQAVPVLAEELARSEEPGWSMEYGSALTTALRAMPGPDSREAIVAYADRLSARIPDDPLARAYFETKIREAREAAETMQTPVNDT